MPTEITIPRLGWSMDEAIFSAWLKQAGEMVRAGDMLFSVESDKATQEIESFDAGVLHLPPNAPKQGDTVLVGQLIGYLLAEGESAPGLEKVPGAQCAVVSDQESANKTTPPAVAQPVVPVKTDSPVSTPRARRVAHERGVDWTIVAGSGRGGRIRETDVRAHKPTSTSSRRRVIAERMLASRQNTAPVTLHTTADATALVMLRNEFKSAGNNTVVPGYNDMLVKLTAAALRAHPVLNSRWDGDDLPASPDIHIGIAVDTETGLLVPVIRDVAKLSLIDVATRSRDLTERARSARLTGDELRGGTFTITNLGAFGIDAFTPIINYPECAILGVGRIRRQPVAVGDSIALRGIITLSLTFDHRAFDGVAAARFLQTLTKLIESPPGGDGGITAARAEE